MRRWIGLAALALAAALMAAVCVALARGLGGLLSDASGTGGAVDPMFEVTEPPVTRPPGLYEDDAAPAVREEDPSRNWVYKTLTPVDTVEPSAQ